jgi:hypothetical protein
VYILQFKVINLYYNNELRTRFKEDDLLKLHVFLKMTSESQAEGNCLCKPVWRHLYW